MKPLLRALLWLFLGACAVAGIANCVGVWYAFAVVTNGVP